jgi:hypothetical protein
MREWMVRQSKKVGLQAERIGARMAVLWTHVCQHPVLYRRIAAMLGIALLLFLALYNLADYPSTWFDEGSHLHVPKTLVRFGVYADYSSEGFRHYGPTIGLGPTVMLPIAVAFWLFGVGLLQARLVMALYLLATVYVFYRLAQLLGGHRLAWLATALLVASRGVGLVLYGRQVLGEVPGLFFLLAGLWVWFAAWSRPRWWALAAAGLLMGLAMVTKYQYLLFLAPALGLAWLANIVYYHSVPHRTFVVPGFVAAASFAVWQLYMILYLGPGTAGENLANLRQFTSGAALALSPRLMSASIKVLMSPSNYMGALLPALSYGFALALPRRRDGLQWGILFVLVAVNLGWYVVASIGWWRYAFLGLAIAGLHVARLFCDLISGLRLHRTGCRDGQEQTPLGRGPMALSWAIVVWLAAMLVLPLAETAWEILVPAFDAPQAMAAYLEESIPQDALIETWEPEMGFLTDHNYHFPPAMLLLDAVQQVHLGGPPVAESYAFVQTAHPEYVLVGDFGRWVEVYPVDLLAARYTLVTRIGGYELYQIAR